MPTDEKCPNCGSQEHLNCTAVTYVFTVVKF